VNPILSEIGFKWKTLGAISLLASVVPYGREERWSARTRDGTKYRKEGFNVEGEMTLTENSLVLLILLLLFLPHLYALGFQNMKMLSMCVCVCVHDKEGSIVCVCVHAHDKEGKI